MRRLNRPVLISELLGGDKAPFGKPSTCSTCGAQSELLTSPEGRQYFQLRCECQRKAVYAAARRTFEAHVSTWRHQLKQIAELERIPEKERDMGNYNAAWGQARKSAQNAKEWSEVFGFNLPAGLVEWGLRHVGAAWV